MRSKPEEAGPNRPLCPRTSDAWHPKHAGDNAYIVLSCFHPLPKYCKKPAHTWEVQNQILLRNLNILLHKSHSINFSRNREKWGKKFKSGKSWWKCKVCEIPLQCPSPLTFEAFSVLKSSTHRGIQGPSCCSCGPRVSLHNLLLFLTFSSIWPSPNWPAAGISAHSQMNPEEPARGVSSYANRDKALYSTRTCRDPAGSWHVWDGQLCQLVQNTPPHTTQPLGLLHFTSLPALATLRTQPLPTSGTPTSEGYIFMFCGFFSDSTLDSHFSLFTPINMLVWSWRCISMRSRAESWHWNVYVFISYTHVCMYVCATVHSCSIVSYSLQSQVL